MVAERLAQAIDRADHTAIEFHKHAVRPKSVTKIFAPENLVRVGKEELQSLKRQLLNPDLHSAFVKFARVQVCFEYSKTD
jgi:hypothetical protein